MRKKRLKAPGRLVQSLRVRVEGASTVASMPVSSCWLVGTTLPSPERNKTA